MGIFKNITKILKKAAPVIGGTIGFAIGGPMGSAALGAAFGSGIGTLVGGGDTDDALKAALLGGIGGYAASGGKFFTPTASAGVTNVSAPVTRASMNAARGIDSAAANLGGGTVKLAESAAPSISSRLFDFVKSPTGIATIGGGLALAGLSNEEKETATKMRDYPVGESRLGYGRIGNKQYNLDNEEDRKRYFEDNRNRGIFSIDPLTRAAGGEVKGPGTGTSDSVPARLSDGEFVATAKAVRGAGGGDRNVGAARMYDMMSDLERVA